MHINIHIEGKHLYIISIIKLLFRGVYTKMSHKSQYLKGKNKLLNDKTICQENKDLWAKFFEFSEYKLKRIRDLRELDESNYLALKTYTSKFRNINKWFKNKPWKELTREDIKTVYDDLEDGKIKTKHGKPFQDRKSIYNKIFRSKPFEMAGKRDLAREVIQFSKPVENEEVRYIIEEEFRLLAETMINVKHKTLGWLAFDVGENINTLLVLKKRNFKKQSNEDTGEPEYLVNLPRKTLKRSRKSRSELTNYPETSKFLDIVLKDLQDDDTVFSFSYRNAVQIIDRVGKITGVKCTPAGQKVTWKDLRSSMACDLLKKGWTTDEINSRLGHVPSSPELNKYVSFLAIGRHKQKKKVEEFQLNKIKKELEESKQREKLYQQRQEYLQNVMAELVAKVSGIEDIQQERNRRKH